LSRPQINLPALILALLVVYLLHLGGAGMLGPDEPRYASIGRAMAHSGDLITPRLNDQPWFEKPPLLYWMVAVGHWLHLSDEWAARLPVALASIAFLIFFGDVLAREFSPPVAAMATGILGTSIGWLAYSSVALTDLPMSAALGAAMLVALFEPFRMDQRVNRGWVAGCLLGLAVLAKGLVPLVLFAPILLIVRRKRLRILAGMLIVAAPWHLLCWMHNGHAFWDDYFWKQHIARFFTPQLEHVQPFWYYVPVLLAGLFPWTPAVLLLARRKVFDDVRILWLGVWVLYGLIFFSAARNKLPGYLLPLLPATAIVLAVAIDKASRLWRTVWLAASAGLLVLLPTAGRVLPQALLSGLGRSHLTFAAGGLLFLIAAAIVGYLAWQQRTEQAVVSLALAALLGIVYLKNTAVPILDRTVSVRPFWVMNQSRLNNACLGPVRRAWEYGLDYYAAREIPDCAPTGNHRSQVNGTEGVLSLVVPGDK
jgi:4-amino-4-deoxy-L-arabinose transferase-like glycosyltransferase